MAEAEAVKGAAAWAKPKAEHKLISKWLRDSRPEALNIIFCLRAEEKVKLEQVPNEKTGKTQTIVTPIGWQPICEKNVPYEMTVSFMLTPDAPGYPKPIKLQEQHKPFFPLDKPVGHATGEKLAAWSAGAPADMAPRIDVPLDTEEGFGPLETLGHWEPGPGNDPEMPPDFGTSPGELEEVQRSISKAEKRQKERTAPGGPRKKVVADLARQAAEKGYEALKEFCSKLEPHERASIKSLVVSELQPLAKAVDEKVPA
jgi:hypothetical protein